MRAKTNDGFTLIEIILVLAIIVFVYSVAIPQFNLKTGSEAATKIGRLQGDIRNAYDLAVLSGKSYRLVFMLLSGDYWIEEANRRDVYIGDEKMGRDPTAAEEQEQLDIFEEKFKDYEALAGETFVDPVTDEPILPTSPVIEAKDSLKPVQWSRVTDIEWKDRTLGPFLIIQDVQAEHHGEKQTFEELGVEARAFIYVFSYGYVEKAVIHVAYRWGDTGIDTDKAPYTIVTEPFSGTAEMLPGYEEVDVKKVDDE